MNTNYKIDDVVDLRIEKIVPRGFGIGFVEGLTILVPLAAPGDQLRVRIRDLKKRLAFAEIVEIVQPGPHRVPAPCPYYGTCGGCDFQHLDYPAQLEAKLGIIRDCLHRIGKIEWNNEIPMIASPKEWEYRSRARFHIDRDKHAMGFYHRNSNAVVDVTQCGVLTPAIETAFQQQRNTIDWDTMWNSSSELEAVEGDGIVSVSSPESAGSTDELSVTIGRETYRYSTATFFQGNKFLIEKLIETAIGDAAGETALDLYCGVGLFSLPLARRFTKVIGIEESPIAIDFARRNAKDADLTNLRFVNEGVEQYLDSGLRNIDLVLLDPPRSGTEKRTIRRLIDLKPSRISYVSCEPSILARDLRLLIDAGYMIGSITALDLFPQTDHVETIVHLNAH